MRSQIYWMGSWTENIRWQLRLCLRWSLELCQCRPRHGGTRLRLSVTAPTLVMQSSTGAARENRQLQWTQHHSNFVRQAVVSLDQRSLLKCHSQSIGFWTVNWA